MALLDFRRSGSGGTHPLVSVWVLFSLVLFCLCVAWTFVVPVGAANDEPAQVIKAVSVVRGEIVGQTASPAVLHRVGGFICSGPSRLQACRQAITVVAIPQSFATFTMPSCSYIFLQQLPAGCGHGLRGSGQEVKAATYVGRYPPLYYAIVGLPSLVSYSNVAVYLMRLLSGLLSALFLGLALALASTWSRSRVLVLGVAVAATPMVIIFGAEVNPSGLAMASAVCVWTGGLILVLDRTSHPPPSLIVATTVAATVMVLTSGLSPLWLAIIAVSLLALAPRRFLSLLQWRSVRIAVGVIAFAGVVGVAYVIWAHSLAVLPAGTSVPSGTPEWGIVEMALGRSDALLKEFIGSFGWGFTSPPLLVMGLWLLSAAVLVVLGFAASLKRHAMVVVALVILSVLLPTVLMVSQAHRDGIVWQARDGYPLYAGILLVAGAVAGRTGSSVVTDSRVPSPFQQVIRRFAWLVAICVGAVQLGDFVWALRRYTVGLGSSLNPLAHVRGGWAPPVPAVILVVLATAATGVYCWLIVRTSRRQPLPKSQAAHQTRKPYGRQRSEEQRLRRPP